MQMRPRVVGSFFIGIVVLSVVVVKEVHVFPGRRFSVHSSNQQPHNMKPATSSFEVNPKSGEYTIALRSYLTDESLVLYSHSQTSPSSGSFTIPCHSKPFLRRIFAEWFSSINVRAITRTPGSVALAS